MASLVFFGSDAWAQDVLRVLADDSAFSIVGIVTQPDRPIGRKQILESTPVKLLARELGYPVFDPESIKAPAVAEKIPAADVFVVCSYGQIIPSTILGRAKHGVLNVHPSFLPSYRGPTPVQTAILDGATEIGISVMLLDELMDHGPMLEQASLSISPSETSDKVFERVGKVAGPLLTRVLKDWLAGSIQPTPQNHAKATYCKVFARETGKVHWTLSAERIYNLFRACHPWPGIWTVWNGKRLKLLNISKSNEALSPGQVVASNGHVLIGAAEGAIAPELVQLEGSKAQPIANFLHGHPSFVGSSVGV